MTAILLPIAAILFGFTLWHIFVAVDEWQQGAHMDALRSTGRALLCACVLGIAVVLWSAV